MDPSKDSSKDSSRDLSKALSKYPNTEELHLNVVRPGSGECGGGSGPRKKLKGGPKVTFQLIP